MGLGAAIVGGLAAVGSIGGALVSSQGAKSAADTQAQAADQSAQIQQNMFNTTQSNLAPWMSAGGGGLTALQQALGLTPGGIAGSGTSLPQMFGLTPGGSGIAGSGTNLAQLLGLAPGGNALAMFQGSPGYQWQLSQGTAAINNTAAARGGLDSGNTLKALQGYGTGLANQDWYNYLNSSVSPYINSATNYVNNLANLSGSGQNAAANLGGFGAQAATGIGNALSNAGAANAAGIVGQSNAINSGITGLTNSLGQVLGNNSPFSGGNSFGGGANNLATTPPSTSPGFDPTFGGLVAS